MLRRLGRPADLRGPFHLRAICTGPARPWGAGAFPAAGSGWAPLTEPQCLWTTGCRSHWGGAAGAGVRAPSSCTRGLCQSPTPETCLRAAASPASGASLDPAGSLTFLARVLCPHPAPRSPDVPTHCGFIRRFRLWPVLPPPPLPQSPRTEGGGGKPAAGGPVFPGEAKTRQLMERNNT